MNNSRISNKDKVISKILKFFINSLRRLKKKNLAMCCHKFDSGMDALVDSGDGKVTCDICKISFYPYCVSEGVEPIQKTIDEIKDIIETNKILYNGNMPNKELKNSANLAVLLDELVNASRHAINYYEDEIMRTTLPTISAGFNNMSRDGMPNNSQTANILNIYHMITEKHHGKTRL